MPNTPCRATSSRAPTARCTRPTPASARCGGSPTPARSAPTTSAAAPPASRRHMAVVGLRARRLADRQAGPRRLQDGIPGHRGRVPGRHRARLRRRAVVHRVARQRDRPADQGRPAHRVPAADAGRVPRRPHRRPRRRAVVHRVQRQPDRPDHDRRGDHRVRAPGRRQHAGRHHRRPRRRALVHRAQRQQDRPHDDRRRAHARVPIPVENATPISIVAGPDGALYYTQHSDGSIARMALDGTVTKRFRLPSGSPDGLGVGPDGDLWFTQGNRGQVGRVDLRWTRRSSPPARRSR